MTCDGQFDWPISVTAALSLLLLGGELTPLTHGGPAPRSSSSKTRAGKDYQEEAVEAACCTPASFARYHVGSGWRYSLAEMAISTSQGVLCQWKSSGVAA